MNKAFLFGLAGLTMVLVGCSNQPVSVAKGNVSVVGAAETKTSDRNIHFSEDNVNGKTSIVQSQTTQKEVVMIPEKATAICNDGTFSMAILIKQYEYQVDFCYGFHGNCPCGYDLHSRFLRR